MIDDDNLDLLIAEATVDARDIDEHLWGFLGHIENEIELPLPASVVGHQVEVTGIDYGGNQQRGLEARVTSQRQSYEVALVDVVFEAGSEAAKFVAAIRKWMLLEP